MATPKSGYVYLLGSTKFGWYKIGKSISPKSRLRDIGVLLPFKVELVALWQSSDCGRLERLMHEKYSKQSINGEWFAFDWLEIEQVKRDGAPFDGALVFPGSLGGLSGTFSNVRKDVTRKGRDEFPRTQKGMAFIDAVRQHLKDAGMEASKANLKAARSALHHKFYDEVGNLRKMPLC